MPKEVGAITKLYDYLVWMVPKLDKFPCFSSRLGAFAREHTFTPWRGYPAGVFHLLHKRKEQERCMQVQVLLLCRLDSVDRNINHSVRIGSGNVNVRAEHFYFSGRHPSRPVAMTAAGRGGEARGIIRGDISCF
ncbi:MAG: hypothetical protein ACOZF0_22240 [Thermodesulfobacteriota bacterium]